MKRRIRTTTPLMAMAAAAVLPAALATSRAQAANCGYMENNEWNVEEGGIVWNRSEGMVKTTIDAIGEWRTHTAINNGFKGDQQWVTHATMQSPRPATSWPELCSNPLRVSDLNNSSPGASQVPIGGYYQFLTGADGQQIVDYKWQSGNAPFGDESWNPTTNQAKWWPAYSERGKKVSDYLWSTMDYQSVYQGADTFYRLKWAGSVIPYGLFQFRDLEGANVGGTNSTGLICSTLASYATFKAGAGWVKEKTYSHQQTVDGMDAIYEAVVAQCQRQAGFWSHVASGTCFDTSLCNEAATQVVTCFATGHCSQGNQSQYWEGIKADPSETSKSISPDCVTGWANGCPWTGHGASPWSWDNDRPVVFSGGGRRYGCWN